MNFNLEEMEKVLYREAKQTFLQIRDDLSDEYIYSLALYTTDNLGYLLPTCSTLEGLERVAKEYKARAHYKDRSLAQLKDLLKWSYADSPYHSIYEDTMNETFEMMFEFDDALSTAYDDEEGGSEEGGDQLLQAAFSTCVKVLRQLDEEGVFGKGEYRKRTVLNIAMGDQSDESRIQFARLLNPPSVAERFAAELVL